MNALVSLIIPIYNVEQYLDECLRSVEMQTHRNLQVILVNDGSTDQSMHIASKYASRNEGWELHNRHNGGLSAALNTGMEVVRGEYVAFVDSDDFVEPDFIERLLRNLLLFNADVSCCNLGEREQELDVFGYWALFPNNNLFCVSRCNKLYRRSMFTEHNYRFPEGKVGEDLFHAIALFRGNTTFCVSPWKGYRYRNNPKSISHNHNVNDWLNILEGWTQLSFLFRSIYGNNTLALYALGNSLEYFRRMKTSYPCRKHELRLAKRMVSGALIWKGVELKNVLRFLRFILVSR